MTIHSFIITKQSHSPTLSTINRIIRECIKIIINTLHSFIPLDHLECIFLFFFSIIQFDFSLIYFSTFSSKKVYSHPPIHKKKKRKASHLFWLTHDFWFGSRVELSSFHFYTNNGICESPISLRICYSVLYITQFLIDLYVFNFFFS